jgi:hypothetical protein
VFIRYTTRPRGTRAGNPTRISSLGSKRHRALDHASKNWKGCRELNSDLKVRSLAPSFRWTTSPIVGRRCRTRTDIQSLEGSVLILLNEAPSCLNLVRDAGIEPASSRLKGECISRSANPAILVGDAGIEPAWSRSRSECISHLCQSPVKPGAGCWNRTNSSRLSIAGSTFELILHGAPFGS